MGEIHARLRTLREMERLSLREMSARLGREGGHSVSHDSIRRYEEGRGIPSSVLIAVCTAFDVSPDWLLLGRGPMRARRQSEAMIALEAVAEIVREFQIGKGD